jgi:hypothetical protein
VEGRTKSEGRRALLEQALLALDRADEYRRLLAGQDPVMVSRGTGTPHLHPLIRAEKEARETFARLAGMLGLNWDPNEDGEATLTPYQQHLERNRQEYEARLTARAMESVRPHQDNGQS